MLTFRSDPKHELNLERLERDSAEIELLGVTDDAGVQVARVFVPEGKLSEFLKLVDAYAASIVHTYVAEPADEAKLKALDDPDKGIKFRGPVRPTKEEEDCTSSSSSLNRKSMGSRIASALLGHAVLREPSQTSR